MIPELGHFALILALGLAILQAAFPLAGSFNGNRGWMAMARPLAWGQFTFAAIAFACLLQAFLTDDFSVAYVATNSNSLMPTLYKVSALWGAHEGSPCCGPCSWRPGEPPWPPSAPTCRLRWCRACCR